MTNRELKRRLHELVFTCGMNQRYHQHAQAWFGWWDKAIRIAVGVLAVAGLVLAVPGMDGHYVGLAVAVASLVVAVALNVVPVADREKVHGELFRLWSELRKDAVLEEQKSCEAADDDNAGKATADRLAELIAKSHQLDASEPAPDRKLLRQCYEAEIAASRPWGSAPTASAEGPASTETAAVAE